MLAGHCVGVRVWRQWCSSLDEEACGHFVSIKWRLAIGIRGKEGQETSHGSCSLDRGLMTHIDCRIHGSRRLEEVYHSIRIVASYKEQKQKLVCPLRSAPMQAFENSKTYSRRDSHVVTHRSTNRPVRCLSSGERTGSSVFTDLWPYVLESELFVIHTG